MKSRVLLVHNHYRSGVPSGENQVVECEGDLLKQKGHQIGEFFRYSDKISNKGLRGSIAGALSTPWNPFSASRIKKVVSTFKPDVVHIHNTFPLVSPSIFQAIGPRSARVLTLHNYRLFCAAAIPMRDGDVCTQCIDRRSSLPAIRYGCYRNSWLAALPLAFGVSLHRALGTWTNHVDAFIAITEFQRYLVVKAGLPAELVHVKPNFYSGKSVVIPWKKRMPAVVFAGRLTAEKGVETLVRAWVKWGGSAPELRIIGDGELREPLKYLAAKTPNVPIKFLGQLTRTETREEIAQSRLLVLPSEWFETFGLVILEAFASQTPAAVSNIGPLSTIVRQGKNGVVFPPGDPQSLLNAIQAAWNKEGELELMASGARHTFESLYTEDINYELLMDIYRQAIDVSQRRNSA